MMPFPRCLLSIAAAAAVFPMPGRVSAAEAAEAAGAPAAATAAEHEAFFDAFRREKIGKAPAPVDPLPREESEQRFDGYTRYRISYRVEPEERVAGILLVPDHAPGERLPLVLALHPTFRDGKAIALGEAVPKNDAEVRKFAARSYAVELVRRGFACFAPDRAAYGERAPLPDEPNVRKNMQAYEQSFRQRHPDWSLTFGKIPYDLSRAIDFLVRRPEIDPDRIGAIGHSLGGWDALFLYGTDPRVKAIVTNSGGSHHIHPELWQSGAARSEFVAGRGPTPVNINTAAQVFWMMGAPKPLLYLRSVKDSGNPSASTPMEHVRLIAAYYASLLPAGQKPQFVFLFHNEGHDFPDYARALAYRWLEKQLKKPPVPAARP